MVFTSGSITDAAPGPALHAAMSPALTTAGFTLVDTVVISTRTHKVWKSPAASNAQNLDWYLDIGYTTTGAGTISIIAFEYFDPATDLGYRGPVTSGGTTIDATTGTRYGATGYALETNWFGAQTAGSQVTVTTTTFTYWISITIDRVILLCSSSPDIPMYAGFYTADALYADKAGAGLFPLYSGRVRGTSYGGGTATAGIGRVYPWTTFSGGNGWTLAAETGGGIDFNAWPLLPAGSTQGYPFVAFRAVILGVWNTSPANPHGRRGELRDVYLLPAASPVARGDTCTINSETYVLSTPLSNCSVAFKSA